MEFKRLTEPLAAQAAGLIVERYASTCAGDAAFRKDAFSVSELAKALIEMDAAGTSVVAINGGEVAGFISGRFINWYGARKAFYSPEWAHSVAPGGDASLIAQMYAWLGRAGELDESSLHVFGIYHSDTAIRATLANLEFGVHQIEGVFTEIKSGRAEPLNGGTRVRSATADDIPGVIELDRGLWEHLARPPISLDLDLANYPQDNPKYKVPRDGSYIAVAEYAGRIVGFMSCRLGAQESVALRDEYVPHINGAFVAPEYRNNGVAQALLGDVMRWCQEISAPRITVDFESTNIEGAGFWLSRAFKPLTLGMIRRTG